MHRLIITIFLKLFLDMMTSNVLLSLPRSSPLLSQPLDSLEATSSLLEVFLFEHGYIFVTSTRAVLTDGFMLFLLSFDISSSAQHDPQRSHFLIDSFPISVCHPMRASRRSLFHGKNSGVITAVSKPGLRALKSMSWPLIGDTPRSF